MQETLDVATWETPASQYTLRRSGNFRLERIHYPPGLHKLYRVLGYTWFHVTAPEPGIPVMALQEERDAEWHDWMIDDPFNYLAMREYCRRARGRVLTAGLGLGLAAHELAANPAVTHITVVERSPEVIDLVGDSIPEQVEVVQDDFWSVALAPAEAWDTIICDIWVTKGKAQHDAVLRDEVWPAARKLKAAHPEATLVCFGWNGPGTPTEIDIQEPYLRHGVAVRRS